MSNYKGPTEGGSGGKRGHSTMEHWTYTQEIKKATKRRRRAEGRRLCRDQADSNAQKPNAK